MASKRDSVSWPWWMGLRRGVVGCKFLVRKDSKVSCHDTGDVHVHFGQEKVRNLEMWLLVLRYHLCAEDLIGDGTSVFDLRENDCERRRDRHHLCIHLWSKSFVHLCVIDIICTFVCGRHHLYIRLWLTPIENIFLCSQIAWKLTTEVTRMCRAKNHFLVHLPILCRKSSRRQSAYPNQKFECDRSEAITFLCVLADVQANRMDMGCVTSNQVLITKDSSDSDALTDTWISPLLEHYTWKDPWAPMSWSQPDSVLILCPGTASLRKVGMQVNLETWHLILENWNSKFDNLRLKLETWYLKLGTWNLMLMLGTWNLKLHTSKLKLKTW